MGSTRGMKRSRMLCAGVSGIAVAALSTPAWSQTTDGQVGASQEATASDQDAPEGQGDVSALDAEAIVITGRRAALEAADQRKRRSESIISSVVADDAGKLPDNSITEVLQRVAGVSIVRFSALNDPDHFSVEGSGIQVRGLSGVASRLNGRDIFSANGGRSLLWGEVTPELMAAVDVYKAATADLIEGGTGGQVDLRTKLPFDFKAGWRAAGTAEISTGDLADATDYSASALLTNRWETEIGEIGILVDVAKSRLTSVSNFFRIEPYFPTRLAGATEDVFIPAGYNYGDENFRRNRTGLYGAVQWAPSDDIDLTGIFFQSRYKNRIRSRFATQSLVPSPTSSFAVDPANSEFDENGGLISTDALFVRDPLTFLPSGASVTSSGGAEGGTTSSLTRDISVAGRWNPGQGPFALSASYQHVKSESDAKRLSIFRDFLLPTSFGLDLTGDFPVVTYPSSVEAAAAIPANYVWAAAMPHEERNRGTMDAVQADAEYMFDDSFFRAVKVGGRWSERRERDLNNGYTWTALGRGWNGAPGGSVYAPQLTFANAAAGDVENYEFEEFFHGKIGLPINNLLWPSMDLVENIEADDLHAAPPAGFCGVADWGNPTYFNCSPAGPLPASGYGGPRSRTGGLLLPNDLGEWQTKSLSGYALVRFGRDYTSDAFGFSGNIGARLVRLENASLGYITQRAAQFVLTPTGPIFNIAERADPRGGERTFTRLLPAVNLQFEPREDVKARVAYNVTMDLPTFTATRGSGEITVVTTPNPNSTPDVQLPPILQGFSADTGNPLLKPTTATNIDLSLEWYPKSGTMFYVNGFYKRLKNLPIYSLTQQVVTIYLQDGTSQEASAGATDVVNADVAAKVKGLEFGGRAFLDMLPGPLAGFGIEANYTFIDSSNPGDVYRDIFGDVRSDAPLQGLSKHNYNLTLLYERSRLSGRIAYSWRSRYLQTTNANGTRTVADPYEYYVAPGVQFNEGDGDGVRISLPIYGASYGQVDASISYRFTDNFSVSLQGTNLFNATLRTLMGGYNNDATYVRSWFQSDRRFTLGANFSF